jgi:hypothetical protein
MGGSMYSFSLVAFSILFILSQSANAGIVGRSLGAALGRTLGKEQTKQNNRPRITQEAVDKVVVQVRKTLPRMIDDTSSLVSITNATQILSYGYLLKTDKATYESNIPKITKAVTDNACSNAFLKELMISNGYKIRYSYFDESRVRLGKVVINKSHCNTIAAN